jgi:hypothetical protein
MTKRFSIDLCVLVVHLHVGKRLNIRQNYTGHQRRLDRFFGHQGVFETPAPYFFLPVFF